MNDMHPEHLFGAGKRCRLVSLHQHDWLDAERPRDFLNLHPARLDVLAVHVGHRHRLKLCVAIQHRNSAFTVRPVSFLPCLAQFLLGLWLQWQAKRQHPRRLAAIARQTCLLLFQDPRQANRLSCCLDCRNAAKPVHCWTAKVKHLAEVEVTVRFVRVIDPDPKAEILELFNRPST